MIFWKGGIPGLGVNSAIGCIFPGRMSRYNMRALYWLVNPLANVAFTTVFCALLVLMRRPMVALVKKFSKKKKTTTER